MAEISDPEIADLPDIERDDMDGEDAIDSGLDSNVDEDGVKHMVLNFSTKSLINLWLIVISVLIINVVLFCCYSRRKERRSTVGFDHREESDALHDV